VKNLQQTDIFFVTLNGKLTLMNKCGVQHRGKFYTRMAAEDINGFTHLLANRRCGEMDS
jgi:hypothetical protein